MKLLNILLLPKSLFQRLTDKKETLIAGIFFVGAIDMYAYLYKHYEDLYLGKSAFDVVLAIVLSLIILIIAGSMDVFLFSWPMFDLFGFLSKKFGTQKRLEEKESKESFNPTVIILMKVYILAHIPVLPLNLISSFAYFKIPPDEYTPVIIMSLVIIYGVIQVWFNCIITHGVSALYKAGFEFVIIVFLAVFMWSYLEGLALEYIISNWLVKLML